jgi:hypothetical protein
LDHLNFLAVLYREALHGWWKVCFRSYALWFCSSVFLLKFSIPSWICHIDWRSPLISLLAYLHLRTKDRYQCACYNGNADHFSQRCLTTKPRVQDHCACRECPVIQRSGNTKESIIDYLIWIVFSSSSTADVLCLPHIFLLGIQSIYFNSSTSPCTLYSSNLCNCTLY